MTQLTDDCFAFGGALLPLADAQARIAARFGCVVGEQRIALAASGGRVLARDVVAALDLPGQANSAVDGYAVHFADLAWDGPTDLPVFGRVSAGHPAGVALPRGFACRIFTGGVMPEGSDTVLMQEDCEVLAEGVRLPPGISRGANCRLAANSVRWSLVKGPTFWFPWAMSQSRSPAGTLGKGRRARQCGQATSRVT